MRLLVTGCAGFIGSKVSELLLDAGNSVVGVDNLNDAYAIRLKEWRLARIESELHPGPVRLPDARRLGGAAHTAAE